MGFLLTGSGNRTEAKTVGKSKLTFDMLHRLECKVCPLNKVKANRSGQMQPLGTKHPRIYMLGGSPNRRADAMDEPFAGESLKVLNLRLPDDAHEVMRWNNVVRSRTPDDRPPTEVEIECCRPSIVRDIEETKPEAIFGFGPVALRWATGFGGTNKWRGRKLPVKIGSHTCWFFPMYSPDEIIEKRRYTPRGDDYGCEDEFVFDLDLRRALDAVHAGLPEPIVWTQQDALADISWVTGAKSGDVDRVLVFIDACYQESLVGFDYETNRLRPYNDGAKLLTAALGTRDATLAFPIDHSQSKWSRTERDTVVKALERFLYEAECRKAVHQLAFELEWSAEFFGRDAVRAQPWGCSVSQAYVLDERMKMGKPDAHSLEFLCLQYFGINLKNISNLDTKTLDSQPLERVLPYNGLDAKFHRMLYRKQTAALKDANLHDAYLSHLERIPTCVLTQRKGVPIAQKVVDEYYERYTKECNVAAEKITALPIVAEFKKRTGKVYRPSAAQDIAFIVTDILKLDLVGKQKAGQVDETALAQIDHPIATLTVEWRKAAKILGTYVVPVRTKPSVLPNGEKTDGSPHIYEDGLMHPIISTTRTTTTRTASEDPNSQNWPKRKNRHIRRQIRARKGHKVVSLDYGQIQARNVAMESKDKALTQAFWDRYDIHSDWVERIVKLHPKWIVEGVKKLATDKDLFKKYRDRAKNEMVFPSFFGAQPRSLAKYLQIPEAKCEELHEDFWDMFPHIKDWHEKVATDYKETGYVTGLSGFRRRAPVTPNEMINAPIQADESAIVLDAMTRLSKRDYVRYQANMEIHDDLTFIWPVEEIEENAEVVIREMLSTPFEWAHCVPLVVEMSIGDNWAEQQKVGEFASDTWSGMDASRFKGWADHAKMQKAIGGLL